MAAAWHGAATLAQPQTPSWVLGAQGVQGGSGGAFTPALDARAAAALGGLLASEPAADAACAAVRSGAPAFARQLADALCGLAERGQARRQGLLPRRVPLGQPLFPAVGAAAALARRFAAHGRERQPKGHVRQAPPAKLKRSQEWGVTSRGHHISPPHLHVLTSALRTFTCACSRSRATEKPECAGRGGRGGPAATGATGAPCTRRGCLAGACGGRGRRRRTASGAAAAGGAHAGAGGRVGDHIRAHPGRRQRRGGGARRGGRHAVAARGEAELQGQSPRARGRNAKAFQSMLSIGFGACTSCSLMLQQPCRLTQAATRS